MTDTAANSLTEKLLAVLRRHLVFLGPGEPLPADARLRELGLNSMGAITLLLDLEQTFGVVIPDELLVAETFESRATLEAALASLIVE